MTIKVAVAGAAGRMGQVSCEAINQASDMTLVTTIDQGTDLADALAKHQPDVLLDFTIPDCVFENTCCAIEHGVSPVVGASGLQPTEIEILKQKCADKRLGGIIAPNFSVGAILMMRVAKEIAPYFPCAEIVEIHHDQKVDSPSGTAAKTAAMITSNREVPYPNQPARGQVIDNVPIHSIRLPGHFAHQTVLFGGEGETLTIRHDSTDRRAMMPGVLLCIRQVGDLQQLIYGLENLLD